MRKHIYLAAALFWTGVIIFLCLIKSSDIPQISLPYFDKVIHAGLHFVFTLLWFFYFKKKIGRFKNYNLLLTALILSIIFGIVIELMQKFCTVTRSADIVDVIANLFGASIAVVSIFFFNKYRGIIDKI